MAGLLVSVAVSANGVIPVLELDFTRSATETLKKIGISDACVIGASSPVAFTFCREGSSTLWKYQALDLEQMAAMQDESSPRRPTSRFPWWSSGVRPVNTRAAWPPPKNEQRYAG